MVSSTATPSDVRGVIETDLSNNDISNYIEDAAFDADQAISDYANSLTTAEKTQLEKYLAALYIRQLKDKAIESTSRETASVSYEGPTIQWLQKQVNKRDPSGSLAYQRDTDRYTSSANYG